MTSIILLDIHTSESSLISNTRDEQIITWMYEEDGIFTVMREELKCTLSMSKSEASHNFEKRDILAKEINYRSNYCYTLIINFSHPFSDKVFLEDTQNAESIHLTKRITLTFLLKWRGGHFREAIESMHSLVIICLRPYPSTFFHRHGTSISAMQWIDDDTSRDMLVLKQLTKCDNLFDENPSRRSE